MNILPTVTTPQHQVVLPSGKKLKIRPFLVKEEKILLMAIEDKDKNSNSLQEALIQILENCIVQPKDMDIKDLSNLDIEFLFLELRKRSVGETIELFYDPKEIFKEDCGKTDCPETVSVKVSLNTIEVVNPENVKKIIMLDENVGITLKYPTLKDSIEISQFKGTDVETLFYTISKTIDEVFDADSAKPSSEFDQKELMDWLENSFGHSQMTEALEFISNAPHLSKDINIVCSVCGRSKEVKAKGLVDFFT